MKNQTGVHIKLLGNFQELFIRTKEQKNKLKIMLKQVYESIINE